MNAIKTLDDVEVGGKTVLVRVDFNCPIDPETGRIKDDTRIRRVEPTIRELAEKGARVVILSHQGDPLDYRNFLSLAEHGERLQAILGKPLSFVDDVCGPTARERIKSLNNGDVLLLENVRYHTEETIIFEKQVALSPSEQAKTPVVAKLAPLADLYVCDAFACVHRSEPTLVGFPEVLPSVAGRLFQKELEVLTQVRDNPQKPCVLVLGGAKILDAFSMMQTVLANGSADTVLTTGLVGIMFLIADGVEPGEPTMATIRSMKLDPFIEQATALRKEFGNRIRCPLDVGVELAGVRENVDVSALPAAGPVLDIGPVTVEKYSDILKTAKTIFMNGPAGVYEMDAFASGTRSLWEAVAASEAFSLIGGGDTIAAAKRFGIADKVSYVCTAGGGLILFLSGKPLPVIDALAKSAELEN